MKETKKKGQNRLQEKNTERKKTSYFTGVLCELVEV